jgi:hypothetical protein
MREKAAQKNYFPTYFHSGELEGSTNTLNFFFKKKTKKQITLTFFLLLSFSCG